MRRSAIACAALGAALSPGVVADYMITNDTWFYGQSDPVYPSPLQDATGAWEASIAKAKLLLDQMTMDEKVAIASGETPTNGCSGMIAGVPRLGFPGLCMVNGVNGVGTADYVSAWASGVSVAASFNKDLAYQRAWFIGGEAKIKGVNIVIGPVVGPIGRVVQGGRNFEGFSPDPYLSGRLVYESTVGTQDAGVITNTKHFLGYEQETHRIVTTISKPYAEPVSSNIDDRTMHELYLWPFQDAVRAGTASIMCSYNKVNNSAACQNSKTLNGLLKEELGFQGFVISDYTAQTAGVASANAGLDVALPASSVWGANLTLAINNGTVNASRLDDMVMRILSGWYQLGQDTDFPSPGYGIPADLNAPHPVVDARNASGRPTLYAGAVEGHVLVKNTNNTLPLKPADLKLISLFGYSAKAPNVNNYEGVPTGELYSAWTQGVESANATEFNAAFLGDLSIPISPIAINGTLISGGGSGTTSQSLISAPYDALVARAYDDGTTLYWDFESPAPLVNPTSNACLVFGNTWSAEGADRPSLRDDYTDGIILAVAEQCANTIVVFHNAGARVLSEDIADHPNVTAIIFAHFPGQDSGRALVNLLYGVENPSGRLPYTLAYNESDYGLLLKPDSPAAGSLFEHYPQSNFTEGVFIDYKRFDQLNITPRYEFGFGLSYTTFAYADLAISLTTSAGNASSTGGSVSSYPSGGIAPGGQVDLWDELVTVTANITNTGAVDGMEVAQLYLGIPGDGDAALPVRQLRGFEKPSLRAGESATVTFPLTRRDLSVWDVVAQKWLLRKGEYKVYVGRSSRDLPLQDVFTIA